MLKSVVGVTRARMKFPTVDERIGKGCLNTKINTRLVITYRMS